MTGVAAVLTQQDVNGFYRPIDFSGRLFNQAESNYTVTDQEMLACIFGIKKYRHYLQDKKFILYTDHAALVTLFSRRESSLNGRIARWLDTVLSFNFEMKFIKGLLNTPADFMSRRTYDTRQAQAPTMSALGKVVLPPKRVAFSNTITIRTFEEDDPIHPSPIVLARPRGILTSVRITKDAVGDTPHARHPLPESITPRSTLAGTYRPSLPWRRDMQQKGGVCTINLLPVYRGAFQSLRFSGRCHVQPLLHLNHPKLPNSYQHLLTRTYMSKCQLLTALS